MPELPEVETIKRDLTKQIKAASIVDVQILDARVIRGISSVRFRQALKGKVIRNIHRRGKALVFEFVSKEVLLVVQLMMTGQLVLSHNFFPEKATKLVFVLSKGRYLLYNDQRLFGRLQIVKDLQAIKYFRILGPEPLTRDFNVSWLMENLRTRGRPIKTLLLDHTFVAGIGNIYAAEILFAAGIDPRRKASSLTAVEVQRLHHSMRKVLREAVRYRGTSMRNYRDASGKKGNFMNRIQVYGREEESCPGCRRKIQRFVQAGRSTYHCSHCQR